QRFQVAVDPRKDPLSCLRSALAVGGSITLNSDTLRTDGLITANQISATSSQVYGKVEATSVSGSTYNGTTNQVTSDKRPTMPDWTSVFNYYRTNGTPLDINQIPQFPQYAPNLAQNNSFDNGTNYWTGSPTGISSADLDLRNDTYHTASYSMHVKNRQAYTAG